MLYRLKVPVTGGNGFLGAFLVNYFRKTGFKVSTPDIKQGGHKNIDFITDLSSDIPDLNKSPFNPVFQLTDLAQINTTNKTYIGSQQKINCQVKLNLQFSSQCLNKMTSTISCREEKTVKFLGWNPQPTLVSIKDIIQD